MFSEEFQQGAHMRSGKCAPDRHGKVRSSHGKAGMVLVLTLGVLVLMSMLAIFFYTLTRSEQTISTDEVNLARAEMLAQTGLEIIKNQLRRPPQKVQWSDQLNINTNFVLPTQELADSTAALPLRHPGTPFFINWTRIVTPGFFDVTSRDKYSLQAGATMPTFLQKKLSDGEPFDDTGCPAVDDSGNVIPGQYVPDTAGNGKFDWYDANLNGIQDAGETIHEGFSAAQDLNHNGVHDSYAGSVKFAVDDVRGTYSLSVLDNTGFIYINDGILTGDQTKWLDERYHPYSSSTPLNDANFARLKLELTRRHSQHLVKLLDNLGVILGMFTEAETYAYDRCPTTIIPSNPTGRPIYQDPLVTSMWYSARQVAPAAGQQYAGGSRVMPTGQGLGYLLIYGVPAAGPIPAVDGRPPEGYLSTKDVRRVLNEIYDPYTGWKMAKGVLTRADIEAQAGQINLLLTLITTVAWVDKTTVVGARFLYPEEQQDLFGTSPSSNEYNYYVKIDALTASSTILRIRGLNPQGILVPGRADEDAKPRYVARMDYAYNPPLVLRYERVLGVPTETFNSMYWTDKKSAVNDAVTTGALNPYDFVEGFDKDNDLDNLMGFLYEPRAPININSAPRPVIEACLAYLEASYVTDRENNLYPNGRGYAKDPNWRWGNKMLDWRKATKPSIFVGTPAYNYYYTEVPKWDTVDKGDGTYGFQAHWRACDDMLADLWGGLYNPFYVSYGLTSPMGSANAEEIRFLVERVNPTIHGTPSVVILPEEARAVAAAIVAYRKGGSAIAPNGDLNRNGILDFADDKDGDGLLRKNIEWMPANPADPNDNFYKGGPFESWEQFWVFLNMQKFRLFNLDYSYNKTPGHTPLVNYGLPFRKNLTTDPNSPDNRLDSRATNLLDLKVDLIFANANPNVDTMDFNPNASWASLNRVDSKGYYLRRNVTKFDLFDVDGNPTHTTEFCFRTTGVYQITSIGRIIAADGALLAERQIVSAIKFFDTMRLTSQKDFELGPHDYYAGRPLGPDLDYLPDAPATHRDYFLNRNICSKYDYGEDAQYLNTEDRHRTMTLPEPEWRATGLDGDPRKLLWQANAAGWDGQITLGTTFLTDTQMNSRQSGPSLRAYGRFSAGEGLSGDTLRGSLLSRANWNNMTEANALDNFVADELNLRLCTGPGSIFWVRATDALRGDDPWVPAGNDYIPIQHPYDYDYLNNRVPTSFDRNRNGVLDYANVSNGVPPTFGIKEPSNAVIVRPLLEPEQFPVTHLYQCYSEQLGDPFGGSRIGIEGGSSVIFPDYLNEFYVGAINMGRYNNFMAYQQTVPRYDREANLVPDGFFRAGARRIYYDLNTYAPNGPYAVRGGLYESPPQAAYPDNANNGGNDNNPGNPLTEKQLVQGFADALENERTAAGNNLAYLVEMWVKPMFTNVLNDNSVHDGNWEENFKDFRMWRFTPWTEKTHGSQYTGGSYTGRSGAVDRQYHTLVQVYFSGKGANPADPADPITKQGALLDVKFFIQPLQMLYKDFTVTSSGSYPFVYGAAWYKQRALFFDAYTQALRTGNPLSFDPLAKVPTAEPVEVHPPEIWGQYIDPDNPNVDTFDYYTPEFRDGEWTHFAVIIQSNHIAYYINGGSPIKEWNTQIDKAFCNNGIERIELPDFPCTVDELRVYTLGTSDGTSMLQQDYAEGRYYRNGTYISPLLALPKGSIVQGINYTEFYPRTLNPINPNDPYGTHVTVKLMTPSANPNVDNEAAVLTSGSNSTIINKPVGDFRIRIEMGSSPNPALDTPVLDDITIYYTVQEQILLWELAD